jgi:hypothetical protein
MDRPDPLIDEVREVRRRISERFGNDPRRLVEHYIELQKQYESRLIHPPASSNTGQTAA